jgi:hypothetical protein
VDITRLPSCGMMLRMFRRCVIGLLVAVLVAGCTSDDTRPPTLPPGVTSPAPKPVKNGLQSECIVGMIRADRANPAEVIYLLGSHVPTWLPKGFGFFIGWRGTKHDLTPSTGAIWTDDTCRQVRLEVFPGAASEESPMPDGRWIRTSNGTCTLGMQRGAPCPTYHAQANGDAISLQLIGLNQQEIGRIVAGIAA